MDDADTARQRARDASRFQLRIEPPGAFQQMQDTVRSHRIVATAIQDGKEAQKMIATPKMPRLAGLAGAMDKLKDGIERGAEKLGSRIVGAETKRNNVFAKGNAYVDGIESELREAEESLDQLDAVLGGNGPPGGGPLDGSAK